MKQRGKENGEMEKQREKEKNEELSIENG